MTCAVLQVAIKKQAMGSNREVLMNLFREILAMVRLGGQPGMLPFKGISYSKDEIWIVTELMAGGDLVDWIGGKRCQTNR